MECENIEKCSFIKKYSSDDNMKYIIPGFKNRYCMKKEDNNKCIRRKICKTLGSCESIPFNMMPNGIPMLDTHDKEWSKEVIEALKIHK